MMQALSEKRLRAIGGNGIQRLNGMTPSTDPENAAIVMGIALFFLLSVIFGIPAHASQGEAKIGVGIACEQRDWLIINDTGESYIYHWNDRETHQILRIEKIN